MPTPAKSLCLALTALGALASLSCASKSHITTIADLPLKTLRLPGMDWQRSPIRANAQYVLHGANSRKERQAKLGDYYFVNWHDATPELPTRVEMLYTQGLTASQVLSRSVEYQEARSSRGARKTNFFFNGDERAKRGDILSWRINLYVDGKLVDSRRSYLWKD